MNKPKVLLLDIETAPLLSYTWGIWDQNVGLNQIKSDWHVLSWAAKWLGDSASKVMYQDQSKAKDIENDKEILKGIWNLLDEADVIITQNGRSFDVKKLNARFILHGFQPPSSFKHIDTLSIAKKVFAFTSNKLEYMTDKLCTKYKKQKHSEFGGFELWKGCLSGDKKAWAAMKKYNIYDILSLEELYNILIPWDSSINFNVYHDELDNECKCGGKYRNKGYVYTATGKFSRHKCLKCGAEVRGRANLFPKEKQQALMMKPPR
jgi:hypothetical protein